MNSIHSLYIHVPFCKHLCNYCDFYKVKFDQGQTQLESFEGFLNDGVPVLDRLHQKFGYQFGELETLYLGGGTPSLWGSRGSQFLSSFGLNLASNVEFTIEVDPGTWDERSLHAWEEIGVNRISVGSQTLNPRLLKVLDRSHNLEETFDLLKFCHEGDRNFSLDFLLGVPHSSEYKRDIIEELKRFLDLAPKHVSLYILNARSKYPLIEAIPNDDYVREEYLRVSDFLISQGFHHYEVSNFALPGFESRHNLRYWNSEPVAAMGPTGTGYFPHPEGALRYKWKVSRPEVETEELTAEQVELEKTYLALRTARGWVPPKLTPQLQKLFQRWSIQGYGEFSEGRLQLNAQGFVILDSLMNDLFRVEISVT